MPVTTHYETSIAGWSFALAKGLDYYGLDSQAIFKKAGIDFTKIETPYTRLPVQSVQKVWRYAYDNTDEYFGVIVSQFLNPASFHALGFGLYASPSLRELLERLIRYRCVISHMFFAELLEEKDCYRLSTTDERTLKTNITHDTLFSFIISLMRQMMLPSFKPMAVRLSRVPKHSIDALTAFMGSPIEFDSKNSELIFTKDQLDTPLTGGDTMLAAKQDQLTEQYISEFGLISEYMLRVKTEISQLLSFGEVSVNKVAENLHVTVRTLQRRLADENSSYHDLLDKVRYELALDYMKDPQTSATEIAFKLGFNDSSSFTRSFKRWTKLSVSEYRSREK